MFRAASASSTRRCCLACRPGSMRRRSSARSSCSASTTTSSRCSWPGRCSPATRSAPRRRPDPACAGLAGCRRSDAGASRTSPWRPPPGRSRCAGRCCSPWACWCRRSEAAWVDPDLADVATQAGQFVPSLIGAGLLVLAIGLSQRVTLAWGATILLLMAGAGYTIAQGPWPWMAGVLILATMLVAPFRSAFYRHARLLSGPLQASTALPLFALVVRAGLGRVRAARAHSWRTTAGGKSCSRRRCRIRCASRSPSRWFWRWWRSGG